VGRRDFNAIRAAYAKSDYTSDFAYYTRVASGLEQRSKYDTDEQVAAYKAKAIAAIEGHDAKSYNAARIAANIAAETTEGAAAGDEHALRWSSSKANAQKGLSEFSSRYYTGFRILEVEVATRNRNAAATPKESTMNTTATIAPDTTAAATTTKKAASKKAAKPTAKKATAKKAAPAKKVAAKKAAKPAAKKVAAKATKKVTAKKAAATTATPNRKETVVTMISKAQGGGATLPELMEATGWQAHSVRSLLSTLGKNITITKEKNEAGAFVYTAA
jgi:hypothetical protein